MDENRGSISCPHGYVRAGECPTCKPLVKLRTLALVKWEKADPQTWVGTCDALDGTQYIAKAVCSTAVNGGWYAYLIANGVLVHQSEHGSRNDAQTEAGNALRRGIELREGV